MNSKERNKLAVVLPSRGLTPRQAYMKKWRDEHREQIKATQRAWYLAHREEQVKYAVDYIKARPELNKKKCQKFRETHPDYAKTYARKRYWEKERYDINFRIKGALRARLRKAIKHNLKTGSAVGELGCSVDELKLYLEKQFKKGMSWDNWGEWHIDHIRPLAKFNLCDREQLLEACHYTNLQPLWASENRAKWDK